MRFNNLEVIFFPISGVMVGIEFFKDDEEDNIFYTIIDLFILRIMILKEL